MADIDVEALTTAFREMVTTTVRRISARQRVVGDILAERAAQDERWGEQNHPTWPSGLPDVPSQYATMAENWKHINGGNVEFYGEAFWDGILLEEVFEALGEVDPIKRRAELIQVAAVAACMAEQIDRDAAAATSADQGNKD